MNGQGGQRPRRPMSREDYERMRAEALKRARAKQRIKRRKIVNTLLVIILLAVSVALIAWAVSKRFNYRDPSDYDLPSATLPSGYTVDPYDPTPTAPPTENPTTPEAHQKGSFTFIAAGDNIIHAAVFEDAQKRAGGNGYDFASMYSGIADVIRSADIAYVNQETPMAGKSYGIQGYPTFNSPQEAGDALVAIGFNTVNIATNHMLDMNTKGFEDSVKYWQSKDVTLLGGYTKTNYDSVIVREVNGIKVAWLSYTYGTNGYKLDPSSEYVIPYIDENDIARQMDIAKRMGDIVIVSMHWGVDSSIPIDASQKEYAQLLADLGADVIIGTHTHTLQSVEYIDSSDGKSRTLCYYSLGNLINTGYEYYKMVGGLASFRVVKDAGGTRVENPVVIPTMCHYSMERDGLQVYLLENYTEAQCAAHGSHRDESSVPNFDLSTLKKLVTDAVDKQFLPASFK